MSHETNNCEDRIGGDTSGMLIMKNKMSLLKNCPCPEVNSALSTVCGPNRNKSNSSLTLLVSISCYHDNSIYEFVAQQAIKMTLFSK
jgi:hypothetical protein